MINQKDMIEIDLIIKDNNTKDILDTTLENIAKESNIFNSKITYKPLTVIYGKGELLKAVEENIKELELNKTKTFSLKKEFAFGERDPKLIQLLPLADFKKENINPVPGMYINTGEHQAKILNVSGGRVQVDYNHDFAGRDLEYTVTLKKIVNDDKEKVRALAEKYFYFVPIDKLNVEFKDKNVEVILPMVLPKDVEYIKFAFAQSVYDITSFEDVKLSQSYPKTKKGD